MLRESTQLAILFGGTAILFVILLAYSMAATYRWHWFWRAHKEIGKTLIWFPWACYELLKGHLGPDVTNALLAGVIGYAGIVLAVGIVSTANPAGLRFNLTLLLVGYLMLGAAIRAIIWNSGILR